MTTLSPGKKAMIPLILTEAQCKDLEFEVFSTEARAYLTRLLRANPEYDFNGQIMHQNRIINRANTIMGKPIYVLESDQHGTYEPAEHAWHESTSELILRQMSSIELIEFLAELVQDGVLCVDTLNDLFKKINSSIFFHVGSKGKVTVEVEPIIDDSKEVEPQPNIRKLVLRMECAVKNNDAPLVVSSAASIFETLAKDVIGTASVQNQTLGKIIGAFKKHSNLSDTIIGWILDIYKRRNTEPLAGHGHLDPPSVTMHEAIILAELTKAIVKAERALARYRSEGIND